jgi:hypothetical protein
LREERREEGEWDEWEGGGNVGPLFSYALLPKITNEFKLEGPRFFMGIYMGEK